ncbi:hypothetical protein AVEN_91043-1 [Araneus ventricosus]|uniref:Uncharacterized protein n=1 Tax=Araneus ventricosus TaxID=182803 RepID=A0A4Y2P0X7_ARAVE|nr:hypothetical protein AVEN_91043-1 [Araneus ventricosus]
MEFYSHCGLQDAIVEFYRSSRTRLAFEAIISDSEFLEPHLTLPYVFCSLRVLQIFQDEARLRSCSFRLGISETTINTALRFLFPSSSTDLPG